MDSKETLSDYSDTVKNIFKLLSYDSKHNTTEDDITFRKQTTRQIINRDSKYTELLSHFIMITKVRNVLKEFFKWTFYAVIIYSIFSLVSITHSLFNNVLSSASIEQIMDCIPLLITAMVGFVSTIITIPVTITKYLFSTKEDQNITQIILHTQEHDTSGRQWAMDFKKIAENLEYANRSKKEKSITAKEQDN